MPTNVDNTNTLTADALASMLAAGDDNTFTTSRDAAAGYLTPLLNTGLPLLPLTPNDKAPYGRFAPSGVYDATADVDYWTGVLDAVYSAPAADAPRLGVGLRLGVRIIVLDADTPPEVVSLQEWLPTVGYPADTPPTVQTPGTVDEDGSPVHHGGGHWYIVLPEDADLDGVPGTIKVGDGNHPAALMTAGYVVMPPTHRNGGRYTVAGDALDATPELLNFLRAEAAREAEKRTAANKKRDTRSGRSPEEQETLDDWRDATSWADLLEQHDYTLADAPDSCGCDKWARPGGSHDYSLVAHDCGRGTYVHNYSDSDDHMEPEESLSKEMLGARLAGMEFKDFMRDVVGIAPVAQGTPGLAESVHRFNANMTDTAVAPLVQSAEVVQSVAPVPTPAVIYDHSTYPLGHPNDPALLADIFSSSPALRALYHRARGSEIYVGPVALLMGELVRTAEVAGPNAGYTTRTAEGTLVRDVLNTFTVVSSPSGGGKSAVTSATAGFARPTSFQADLATTPVERGGVASGQAVVDMLTETITDDTGDDGKPHKVTRMIDPAVATVEVDELASLLASNSTGGYLKDVLLSAWSGKPFGERSRTHGAKRVTGRYVLNLVGGVQPARADVLVGAEAKASGLLQRLVITDVSDPWRPALRKGLMESGVDPSDVTTLPAIPVGQEVTLPPAARTALAEEQDAVAAGTLAPEDGHLLHVRMRLACLTALWHGTTEVSTEMWDWSALLIEHHRRARAMTTVLCEDAAQDAETATATRRAVGNVAAADTINDRVAEVATTLLDKIAAGKSTQREMRRSVSKNRAPHVVAAVQVLLTAGKITETTPGHFAVVS